MQESNRGGSSNHVDTDQREETSDATSKETLADVEETEKVSDSASDSTDGQPVPSPDGTPDSDRAGRADGSDTGGPM
jgi:hypothetical protein